MAMFIARKISPGLLYVDRVEKRFPAKVDRLFHRIVKLQYTTELELHFKCHIIIASHR